MKPRNEAKKNTPVRRLLAGAVPYILFLTAVSVISIGLLRFIEQESVLAIFLTDRGSANSVVHQNPGSYEPTGPTLSPTEAGNPSATPGTTPVPGPYPGVPASTPDAWSDPEIITGTDSIDYPGTEPERTIAHFYYIGDKIGTLSIPGVDLKVDVLQGDREAELRLGAGHYPGSYLPGQGGNILIAAHRTTHFKSLEHLEVGDKVYFETTYGEFIYTIDEIRIIKGGDNSVAGETEREQLTLYTCYPFTYLGNAPNRFVAICTLAEDQSDEADH